ncbi:MAG: RNA polymerase sigma factor [Parcubacteria group bacterium GW2011_GWF1_52_5]|nr:MAG: RNA polymerase sigma factor [Parcubacteria group bacterium GW2011_GWF1_52_5]
MKAKETGKKSAAKALVVNPKDTVKALLTALPARAQDVIRQRYGLGKSSERATLEAIGDVYGITRERVRQIENFALKTIRKSPAYTAAQYAFDGLEEALVNYGGFWPTSRQIREFRTRRISSSCSGIALKNCARMTNSTIVGRWTRSLATKSTPLCASSAPV